MKMKPKPLVILIVLAVLAAAAVAFSLSYTPPKVQVPAYMPKAGEQSPNGGVTLGPTMTMEELQKLPRPTFDPDAPVIKPEDMLSDEEKKKLFFGDGKTVAPATTEPTVEPTP